MISVIVCVSQLRGLIGAKDFSDGLEGSTACRSKLVWKALQEGDLGLFEASIKAVAGSNNDPRTIEQRSRGVRAL